MKGVVLNPPVAAGSLIIIAAMMIYGGFWPEHAGNLFEDVLAWVLDRFGWLFVVSVAIYTVAAFYFALSRYGQIRLGPDDAEPEFSFTAWSAMLFAAGIGIGLMFYGVAEPILHSVQPPAGEPGTAESQREAMVATLFHWGINGWAIFGMVGLSLAYFGYRYNLPLTIRSGLYPLIKERINGPIGHAVDIFAITGTLFGIATSLGLGVLQMNSGLDYLFGIEESTTVQVGLIFGVMGIAAISVVAGLDKGVRRLSELNLSVAILLVIFILVVGPSLYLLQSMIQNTGMYLDQIVYRTFNLYAYAPTQWFNDWTLFYWGWWISWSPFVGMFIARISRGRTVRQFVLGVLGVPTALTIVWMTVFGNTAFWLNDGEADGALATAVQANVSTALFQFLEYLPLSSITSGLALLLIAVFFVTSADSGSLVLDTLASGGSEDTPTYQRLFWTVLEASVASVLLVAGGLTALQTATITTALPFALVIVVLCIGLAKGLSADAAGRMLVRQYRHPPQLVGEAQHSWNKRLASLLRPPDEEQVRSYIAETVDPALEQLKDEYCERGVEATVRRESGDVILVVPAEETRDFIYGVKVASESLPGFVLRSLQEKASSQRRFWMALTHFVDGRRGYNVMGYTKDQIISDAVNQYDLYRQVARSPQTRLYMTSPDTDPREVRGAVETIEGDEPVEDRNTPER